MARYRSFRSGRIRAKATARLQLRRKMQDGPESIRPIEHIITDPDKRMDAFARYYDYTRKEIEREDGITFARLNLTLAFQAFLIGATVFLFSGLIALVSKLTSSASQEINSAPQEILKLFPDINYMFVLVDLIVLILISLMGFVVSHFSYRGIKSSRESLHWTKEMWITFNEKNGRMYPSLFPQPTKNAMLRHADRHRTDQGTDFALAIPLVLRVFWVLICFLWVGILASLLILRPLMHMNLNP